MHRKPLTMHEGAREKGEAFTGKLSCFRRSTFFRPPTSALCLPFCVFYFLLPIFDFRPLACLAEASAKAGLPSVAGAHFRADYLPATMDVFFVLSSTLTLNCLPFSPVPSTSFWS
jgi:hypothetical protein